MSGRARRIATAVRSPRFGDDWWRAESSTRSIRAASPTRTATASATCPGIIDHLDHLGPDGLGRRRHLAVADLSVAGAATSATTSATTSASTPCSGPRTTSTASSTAAHRRGIRVVLDLVMNHTSSAHPWFEASRARRDGPHADWYLWRDPSGTGPGGEPLPPNNWVSFFGGPGWEWDAVAGSSTTTPSWSSSRSWTGGPRASRRPSSGWSAAGSIAASTGSGSTSSTCFLKHPDLPSNPTRPGGSAWARQVHLNDGDQPDFPALIGRFRAIVDERPGRMSIGELFDGTVETAAGLTPIATSCSTGSWSSRRGPRRRSGPRSPGAKPRSGPTAGRRSCSRTTIGRGSPRAWPTRSPAPIATRSRGAAAVLLLTLRGTPFLYYGEELGMADVDIPAAESVDPPAGRVGPDFSWWDRSRSPDADALDGPAPAPASRRGRPWLRLRTRRGHAQRGRWRRPTRRRSCRSTAVSSRCEPTTAALQVGTPAARCRRPPATSSPTRGRPMTRQILVVAQPRPRRGRLAAAGRAARSEAGGGSVGTRATTVAGRAARRPARRSTWPPDERRHPRAHRLTVPAIAPATMTGDPSSPTPGSTTCRLNS